MAADPGFVHLRVHSSYSLLEGAIHIKGLVSLAKADKQPALAVTDTGNLFGALEFSEKAFESGIQPIIGCELLVDFLDETGGRRAPVGRDGAGPLAPLVLLAATPSGYDALARRVSRA